jgi:DNA-binding CsgD family transcriptional regulator
MAEEGLRQLYGLTPSEARLANLMMEGNPLDACCKELQIRPSTARMHLSNLFAKTGVQRQGQLIALLVRSLGILPGSEPSEVRQEESLKAGSIPLQVPYDLA